MLSCALARLLTLRLLLLIAATKETEAAPRIGWFFHPADFFDLAHGPVQVAHALPHACVTLTADRIEADLAVCDLSAIGAHP